MVEDSLTALVFSTFPTLSSEMAELWNKKDENGSKENLCKERAMEALGRGGHMRENQSDRVWSTGKARGVCRNGVDVQLFRKLILDFKKSLNRMAFFLLFVCMYESDLHIAVKRMFCD